MLPSKTVFILGAGASKEVKLPIGRELKNIIATKLDLRFDDFGTKHIGTGDLTIFQVLRNKFPFEINNLLAACWSIRDGVVLSSSIDDFIDAHQHDLDVARCGKLAIARSILEAERSSALYYERQNVNDTINFSAIQGTWYTGFYQLLTQGVRKGRLETLFDNVTVVDFNYDRCLPHFLVHAIAGGYRIPLNQTAELVATLPMFHPFGSVGQYFGPPHQTIEFGFKGIPNFEIINNLKTYTEQIADDVGLQAIRKAIIDAEVIVFLGTAFHQNNMKLLSDPGHKTDGFNKRIFLTRKGIKSDSDLKVVLNDIYRLCGGRTYPMDVYSHNFHIAEECHQLFDQYHRTLRR